MEREIAGIADYTLVLSDPATPFEQWIKSQGRSDPLIELATALLGGHGRFFDFGANIGSIAVPIALSGPHVICIEPNAENCLRLYLAKKANRLDRFEVLQVAGSSVDGITHFTGSEAWGHVSTDAKAPEVVCLTADSIASLYDSAPGPTVVKIDVEGHEPDVIRGAQKLLATSPAVIFESIEIEGEPSPGPRARQALSDLGFALYAIHKDRVLRPVAATDIQYEHIVDYLALPADDASDWLARAVGFAVRTITEDERAHWILRSLKAATPGHQRHATNVVSRLLREGADPQPLAQVITELRL